MIVRIDVTVQGTDAVQGKCSWISATAGPAVVLATDVVSWWRLSTRMQSARTCREKSGPLGAVLAGSGMARFADLYVVMQQRSIAVALCVLWTLCLTEEGSCERVSGHLGPLFRAGLASHVGICLLSGYMTSTRRCGVAVSAAYS
jgi:hypothetical protein